MLALKECLPNFNKRALRTRHQGGQCLGAASKVKVLFTLRAETAKIVCDWIGGGSFKALFCLLMT